jgi:hypothetical protein
MAVNSFGHGIAPAASIAACIGFRNAESDFPRIMGSINSSPSSALSQAS